MRWNQLIVELQYKEPTTDGDDHKTEEIVLLIVKLRRRKCLKFIQIIEAVVCFGTTFDFIVYFIFLKRCMYVQLEGLSIIYRNTNFLQKNIFHFFAKFQTVSSIEKCWISKKGILFHFHSTRKYFGQYIDLLSFIVRPTYLTLVGSSSSWMVRICVRKRNCRKYTLKE